MFESISSCMVHRLVNWSSMIINSSEACHLLGSFIFVLASSRADWCYIVDFLCRKIKKL